MKIVVCGSMTFSKKMLELRDSLVILGHESVIPRHTEEYAILKTDDRIHNESVKNKINHDLIRGYFKEINEGDAVLVVNEKKNGIENYIGGNSFLEMGFAHVLNKKIFLLNPIPNMGYKDEIIAMTPLILMGDLSQIK